jgi:uncharacterized protein
MRDLESIAPAEVPATRGARRKGLLGRDGIEGALVIKPCRQVHTMGMKFAIDVAFCDRSGLVIHSATMKPGRLSRFVVRSSLAIEAEAGSFAEWGLAIGDVIEVRA